ncbi:MAG: S8 family serine peptidase [Candidatus Zixiibacteriota bacterium]
MSSRVVTFSASLTSVCIVTAIFIIDSVSISAATAQLSPEPVVIAKSTEVVSARTRQILEHRNPSSATVWIFFTDKGVTDRPGYTQKAAAVHLTERARARRAKVGHENVLFVDLPVESTYLRGIESLGGKLRRESRWLNAASFDLPMDRLNDVASLPYVAQIKPVARFVREPEPVIESELPSAPTAPMQPDALNYGSSLGQLTQMNVPQVHDQGYNGQGVTLAVFDTGFRKSHEAFAQAYLEGRVLAEYDFVFNDGNTANEPGDVSSAWSHGTSTWSLAGGMKDGTMYGGAYKANFILCKTEDVRMESHMEEDNWVAALEWVDSIGADVVTSSLGYGVFDDSTYSYTYADMDGNTAIITLAANTADGLGIIVCNSMGNSGPGAGTLTAPADAFNILAVGAVSSTGTIASFSSRGPTFDGRTKPEICAQGINTYAASSSGDVAYSSSFSGTSAACPLAAGAVCLMVQAHPDFTPQMIRDAVMQTASRASIPDNNYGWGIVNIEAALGWPIAISADITQGNAPMTVNFTGSSALAASSWLWHFGDGDSSALQNPSHNYTVPGLYDVSLSVMTTYGLITNLKTAYIVALGDTLNFGLDSAFAGQQVVNSVYLANSQPLSRIVIPFKLASTPLNITFDSVSLGSRTSYFEALNYLNFDPTNKRYTIELKADNGGGAPDLTTGNGEVLKIYCTTNQFAFGGLANVVDTTDVFTNKLNLYSPALTYKPVVNTGVIATKNILRGDCNYDFLLDISDLQFIVDRLFFGGPPAVTIQSGDWTHDFLQDISDLQMAVDFLFFGGPPPTNP